MPVVHRTSILAVSLLLLPHLCCVPALHRTGSQDVPLLRMSYEERIRALEEALAARDRSVAQLTQRLAQAEAEYQQVGVGLWRGPKYICI